MFNSILVVCLGNLCRSPVAEFLFRRALGGRDVRVGSAGPGALVGRPMARDAAELLQEDGIDASAHRARQLEPSMLREADLVLAMERRQLRPVVRLAPEASGKVSSSTSGRRAMTCRIPAGARAVCSRKYTPQSNVA